MRALETKLNCSLVALYHHKKIWPQRNMFRTISNCHYHLWKTFCSWTSSWRVAGMLKKVNCFVLTSIKLGIIHLVRTKKCSIPNQREDSKLFNMTSKWCNHCQRYVIFTLSNIYIKKFVHPYYSFMFEVTQHCFFQLIPIDLYGKKSCRSIYMVDLLNTQLNISPCFLKRFHMPCLNLLTLWDRLFQNFVTNFL